MIHFNTIVKYVKKSSKKLFVIFVFMAFSSSAMSQGDVSTLELYPNGTLCPKTPFDILYPMPPEIYGYTLDYGAWTYMLPEAAYFISADVFGWDVGVPLRLHYIVEYIGGMTQNPDEDLPIRFYLLIDEEFIPLEGKGQLYRDVVLPFRQQEILTFELPGLETGVHDVILLGIGNYERLPDKYGDIASMEPFDYRMTLVVGNPAIPIEDQRKYTLLPGGLAGKEDHTIREEQGIRAPLMLSLNDASWLWNQPEPTLQLTPNETFTFNIQAGPTAHYTDWSFTEKSYPEKRRFAIIMLEDYMPVQLGADTLAFYGEMSLDSVFVQFPVTRSAPPAGRRDIIVLRIDEPGTLLCHMVDPVQRGLETRRVAVEVK
ncbi:MAG TPA: hypothetical protein VHO69_11850 [Phototrophicaceae bacterium]|nr:hypothetical protein [Phototrophicaceae bacterium]